MGDLTMQSRARGRELLSLERLEYVHLLIIPDEGVSKISDNIQEKTESIFCTGCGCSGWCKCFLFYAELRLKLHFLMENMENF